MLMGLNPFSNSQGGAVLTLLASVNGDNSQFDGVETRVANMSLACQAGFGRAPPCSSNDLVFGRTGESAAASTLIYPAARILSSLLWSSHITRRLSQ